MWRKHLGNKLLCYLSKIETSIHIVICLVSKWRNNGYATCKVCKDKIYLAYINNNSICFDCEDNEFDNEVIS
jgi:hypothetical protein